MLKLNAVVRLADRMQRCKHSSRDVRAPWRVQTALLSVIMPF